MPSPPPSSSTAGSAAEVFDALAGRLPPRHERRVGYSEVEFSDPEGLRRMLDRGSPIVASYTHTWRGWVGRYSDLFVTWTFGSLGSVPVVLLIGSMLGAASDDLHQVAVMFGISLLIGLGLALRYSLQLPRGAEQWVTLFDGESRELIHASREFGEQPVERVMRIPLSDLVIQLAWGQIADHAPSFISVSLAENPSIGDGAKRWQGLCLTTVDHRYPGHVPEELVRQAQAFAETLGARYVGLEPHRVEP